jgi:hypothetical protein
MALPTGLPLAQGAAAPGGVYLCQTNAAVSCGACCGLYNVADPRLPALMALLTERTQAFARILRTPDAIDDFGLFWQRMTAAGPVADFYHCPFLGLVGRDKTRVGCLLHPLACGNGGRDFRDLSYYGGMACRTYFCPSHHRLEPAVKQLVIATATHWYDYGMIVTETGLLQGLFDLVVHRLGRPLHPVVRPLDPKALSAVRGLLAIKLTWPYRRAGWHPVHYFFGDKPQATTAIDNGDPWMDTSPLGPIFGALGAVFENADTLRVAEEMIQRKVEAVAAALDIDSKNQRYAHSPVTLGRQE